MKHGAAVAALAAVGLALRIGLGLRTGISSNDGALYLWAGESIASGEVAAAFQSVFHAGAALAIAPFIALGCPPYLGALLAGSLAFLLSLVLLERIGAAFAVTPRVRLGVLALFALGFHCVRLPADVYSESFAIPVVCAAVLFALQGRLVLSAFAAGAAYWVRPETVLCGLIPLYFALRARRWRSAALLGIALCVPVLGYSLSASFLAGDTVSATPKWSFMLPLGPLGAVFDGNFSAAFERLWGNCVRLPGAAMSGLDYAVFFIALFGVQRCWSSAAGSSPVLGSGFARAAALWIVAHLFVCLCFQVKPRFFLMLSPVVYPLVMLALRDRGRSIAVTVVVGLTAAVATLRVVRDVLRPPRVDKMIELVVGVDLAREFGPAAVVSSLPRVMWAAGERPLDPWPWTVASLFEHKEGALRNCRVLVVLATAENRQAMQGHPEFELRDVLEGRLAIYVRV